MPSAIVFDLDYTLAVPERDRATLLADASEAAGTRPIDRADYTLAHRESSHAETREPIFERLLDGDDTDVTAADVASAYRDAVADAMTPVDGAADLVASLRTQYAVGLLTDGPAQAGRSKLAALGWDDLFDAALVTGEIGADKPDPAGFRAVCDRLGVAPGDAVYVGDSPELDVAGAADAGMAVVQVLFDGGPDPDPRADATVERERLAGELRSIVAGL